MLWRAPQMSIAYKDDRDSVLSRMARVEAEHQQLHSRLEAITERNATENPRSHYGALENRGAAMPSRTESEPEKIYRTVTGPSFDPVVTCQESPQVGCNTPYIRLDLYTDLKAENEKLRKLLAAADHPYLEATCSGELEV